MRVKVNAATRLIAAVSAKAIEREIKKRFGYDVKLHKGKGYFYFADPDDAPMRVSRWDSAAVYVNSLNQMDLNSWLAEFEDLMKDNKDRE